MGFSSYHFIFQHVLLSREYVMAVESLQSPVSATLVIGWKCPVQVPHPSAYLQHKVWNWESWLRNNLPPLSTIFRPKLVSPSALAARTVFSSISRDRNQTFISKQSSPGHNQRCIKKRAEDLCCNLMLISYLHLFIFHPLIFAFPEMNVLNRLLDWMSARLK